MKSSQQYTLSKTEDQALAAQLKDLDRQYPAIQKEPVSDDIVEWAEANRTLKGSKFTFKGREYLIDICRSAINCRQTYLVKGRQIGASESAVTAMLYYAIKHAGSICLYMSSNAEKAKTFSKLRIKNWAVSTSPKIAEQFSKDEDLVMSRQLKNGSILLFRSSQDDFEATRSIPANFLILDECQSMPMKALPVATEALAETKGNLLCIGTGAPTNSAWHDVYKTGTERHYNSKTKKWRKVSGQKDQKNARSFFLPQSATGRFTAKEIKEKLENYHGSHTRALEEIEGAWTESAEVPFPHTIMQNCIVTETVRANNEDQFLGVDWGGGKKSSTVMTLIHYEKESDTFVIDGVHTVDTSRVEAQTKRVLEYIERMNPAGICVDLGGQIAAVQKLEDRYGKRIVKAWFSSNIADPFQFKSDKNQVHIDKSTAIEELIEITSQQRLQIPKRADWILSHFECIQGSPQTNRSGQNYTQYSTDKVKHQDDAAMSLLYAHAAFKLKGKSRSRILGIVW